MSDHNFYHETSDHDSFTDTDTDTASVSPRFPREEASSPSSANAAPSLSSAASFSTSSDGGQTTTGSSVSSLSGGSQSGRHYDFALADVTQMAPSMSERDQTPKAMMMQSMLPAPAMSYARQQTDKPLYRRVTMPMASAALGPSPFALKQGAAPAPLLARAHGREFRAGVPPMLARSGQERGAATAAAAHGTPSGGALGDVQVPALLPFWPLDPHSHVAVELPEAASATALVRTLDAFLLGTCGDVARRPLKGKWKCSHSAQQAVHCAVVVRVFDRPAADDASSKKAVVVEFNHRDGDASAFFSLWRAWLKTLSEAGFAHSKENEAPSKLSARAAPGRGRPAGSSTTAGLAPPPAPADGGLGIAAPGAFASDAADGSGVDAIAAFRTGAEPLRCLVRSCDPRAQRDGACGLARLTANENSCYPLAVHCKVVPDLIRLLHSSAGKMRGMRGAEAAAAAAAGQGGGGGDAPTTLFALTTLANMSAVETCQETLIAAGAVPVLHEAALGPHAGQTEARREAVRALVNLDQGAPAAVRAVVKGCPVLAARLEAGLASPDAEVRGMAGRLARFSER